MASDAETMDRLMKIRQTLDDDTPCNGTDMVVVAVAGASRMAMVHALKGIAQLHVIRERMFRDMAERVTEPGETIEVTNAPGFMLDPGEYVPGDQAEIEAQAALNALAQARICWGGINDAHAAVEIARIDLADLRDELTESADVRVTCVDEAPASPTIN